MENNIWNNELDQIASHTNRLNNQVHGMFEEFLSNMNDEELEAMGIFTENKKKQYFNVNIEFATQLEVLEGLYQQIILMQTKINDMKLARDKLDMDLLTESELKRIYESTSRYRDQSERRILAIDLYLKQLENKIESLQSKKEDILSEIEKLQSTKIKLDNKLDNIFDAMCKEAENGKLCGVPINNKELLIYKIRSIQGNASKKSSREKRSLVNEALNDHVDKNNPGLIKIIVGMSGIDGILATMAYVETKIKIAETQLSVLNLELDSVTKERSLISVKYSLQENSSVVKDKNGQISASSNIESTLSTTSKVRAALLQTANDSNVIHVISSGGEHKKENVDNLVPGRINVKFTDINSRCNSNKNPDVQELSAMIKRKRSDLKLQPAQSAAYKTHGAGIEAPLGLNSEENSLKEKIIDTKKELDVTPQAASSAGTKASDAPVRVKRQRSDLDSQPTPSAAYKMQGTGVETPLGLNNETHALRATIIDTKKKSDVTPQAAPSSREKSSDAPVRVRRQRSDLDSQPSPSAAYKIHGAGIDTQSNLHTESNILNSKTDDTQQKLELSTQSSLSAEAEVSGTPVRVKRQRSDLGLPSDSDPTSSRFRP